MTNLTVARVPTHNLGYYQGKMTAEYLDKARFTLVHYDVIEKRLTAYTWPVMRFYALKPPLWEEHRITHKFRFPCCFCPSRTFGGDGKYKETNVEKGLEGRYAGKWVATCATQNCSYFACLDDFVEKPWIGTKEYDKRVGEGNGSAVSIAQSNSHPADQTRRPKTKGRSIRFSLMRSDPSYPIGSFNFWKLDMGSQPGLTAVEFYKLFTECRCGLIMTRRTFRRHCCQFTVVELDSEGEIMNDLTRDSEDDEMAESTASS